MRGLLIHVPKKIALPFCIVFTLLITGCSKDINPDQIIGTWKFVESTGGQLGPQMADPNSPIFLTFQKDGRVYRTANDTIQVEWEYKAKKQGAALHLLYKWSVDKDFELQNRVYFREGDEIIIEPYFGKNTHCADCSTSIYRKVVTG